MSSPHNTPDILIAGAGIIGLSLALELHARHVTVAVIDPELALRQTTWAAAGMLAADDPHNPAALHPLASFSVSLYPAYLRRIEAITGIAVPFQTDTVVQHLPGGATQRLAEHSVDPRQLAEALLAAVRSTPIALYENAGRWDFADLDGPLHIRTTSGVNLFPGQLVHASGVWFKGRPIVTPRKGQMLRVAMPPSLDLREVHRRVDTYIVPRTQGPQAGTAIIGATDEDAGYDLRTHTLDLDRLRSLAAELLPAFASAEDAPAVEWWAGLRPATPDLLPLLGALSPRQFLATGHFRNGILLAPATAVLIADLDTKQATSLDWTRRRADDPHLNPKIQAMALSTVPAALRITEKHDLVIFDMPPHSSNGTAELAKACDVMFIPTGTTVDDLVPTVRLLHELVKAGMTAKRIAVIMVRGIDSEAQIEAAHTFITEAGYTCLLPALPLRPSEVRGRAATA